MGAANTAINSITATQLAAGAVGSNQLAAGAALANLTTSGQLGVAVGGMGLLQAENATLLQAGYVKLGTIQGGDTWQERLNGTAPGVRRNHKAAWTGSEMIV